MAKHVDTLIVGGGQAGLCLSEHLGKKGIDHLILERDRIAESWRTQRWDSLVANGPAWHDRFPGLKFDWMDPDGFATKHDVVRYMETYANAIDAPIQTGVDVKKVARKSGAPGFDVETSDGRYDALNVVAATGPFQTPVIPPIVPDLAGVTQIHSTAYRNPEALREGAVLVVGSGSSGTQIADELMQAGRDVYLSVGPHDRPPRAYRQRDFCWWLGVLGKWDLATVDPKTAHVTIAVSGAGGGKTVDFRRLAHDGMTLVGMTDRFDDGILHFAGDLGANLKAGDEKHLAMLRACDAYVARNGTPLPEEPNAHIIPDDPPCVTTPIRKIDPAKAGITTIIWATGFRLDFDWLQVDAFEADGRPKHLRGVSSEPGVYFLGLPWLSRRGSSFIWGVWHDAKYIADQIAIQKSYRDYDGIGRAAAE